MLNSHYPYLAFTSSRPIDVCSFPFIEHPELSEVLKEYYLILSVSQLSETVEFTKKAKRIIVKNANTLHQRELEQLVYWQPKTVGEIIFNYWD
ncbi:hypothetical protein [Bacillus pinisoli]|uniref:hypothetical protein n=1 Tax=Bacillus pinisoli TaxID=2901866 RepID=UPI001FF439E4|nr:hypothetical protein [Bacillus pinisoli]